MMAFSSIPSACGKTGLCKQFGDVSYLLAEPYESWLRAAIERAPRITLTDVTRPPIRLLDAAQVYVLPFRREQFASLAEAMGLRPKGTQHAIPPDIRAEHHGVVAARHLQSRARVLLVDQRGSKGYLHSEQLRMSKHCKPVAGARGESCSAACSARGLECDVAQMHFLNDCHALKRHFACEEGCAHQVGKELPVYVPDDFQPTYRQCLVTFISAMNCDAKHASTARLCACMPRWSSATGR